MLIASCARQYSRAKGVSFVEKERRFFPFGRAKSIKYCAFLKKFSTTFISRRQTQTKQ